MEQSFEIGIEDGAWDALSAQGACQFGNSRWGFAGFHNRGVDQQHFIRVFLLPALCDAFFRVGLKSPAALPWKRELPEISMS
jgi:hypothetical protein